jgi:hypothetical protein
MGEKCGLKRGFEVATSWLPNLGIEIMSEQQSEVAAVKRRSMLCGCFLYRSFILPAMLLCLLMSPAKRDEKGPMSSRDLWSFCCASMFYVLDVGGRLREYESLVGIMLGSSPSSLRWSYLLHEIFDIWLVVLRNISGTAVGRSGSCQ